MPLPKEILDSVEEDIKEADSAIAELRDVVTDMRLAGMDTTKQEAELDKLTDEIRKLRIFDARQRAKSE
jgi:signal transduction histidine kinase